MKHTLKLAALAAAIMGLLALPAGASAWATWTNGSTYEPLAEITTANVDGSIRYYDDGYNVANDATCDVSGEIELWNDGSGWTPGKNQVAGLTFSNCVGNVGGCQATGATAQDLPWSGDLSDYWRADFAGAKITWTGSCGSSAPGSSVPITGSLEALLPTDFYPCVDGFDFVDDQPVYVGNLLMELEGFLEVTSVDGVIGPPADCVLPL